MTEYNDYFQLGNPLTSLKSKVSHNARKKMFAHFMRFAAPTVSSTVLDIGVTPDTSLPENNFFEKLYPWQHNITMASVEDASNLEREFPYARFVRTTPGERFPFTDRIFDIVFCSAVLEYVGDYSEQAKFLCECLRVGKKLYLTTPNKYFPIEMHTYLPLVHWLPRKLHQAILRTLGMKFFSETKNLNLLKEKDIRSMLPQHINYFISFNRTFGLKSNIILCVEAITEPPCFT